MKKMISILKKRKEGSGAIGYTLLFFMAMIMVMMTIFMIQEAKLMTHQHDIDDALADAVLASLVADDNYYFDTIKDGTDGVLRFRDKKQSYKDYIECMNTAIGNTEGFYYNFQFSEFIMYEVENDKVTIVKYKGNSGVKTEATGTLGKVKTPEGKVVEHTGAYAKVQFDIKSMITDEYITKTRDIYCVLKVNKKED